MSWTFVWLRSWNSIWSEENLRRWQDALSQEDVHATPFMHPAVIRGWLAANGGEAAFTPFFVHARHTSGQEVFWLLVRPHSKWRTGFLRVLHPVGCDMFDYHDPIVTHPVSRESVFAPDFWRAFEHEMHRHAGVWFDRCALSRIRPSCFADRNFVEQGGKGALVRLDAYKDFAAYMDARRGSINKLDRKLRKFASSGESELRIYGPGDQAEIMTWMPALIAALQVRYPNGEISPTFLRSLVAEALDSGILYCSSLKLDGKPFSWRIGFRLHGTYYDYVCGFDAEFGRLSPGLLHIHALIKSFYEAGNVRVYDFLLGAENYKADWTDGEEVPVRNTCLRSTAFSSMPRTLVRRGLSVMNRTVPTLTNRLPPVDGLLGGEGRLVPTAGPQRKAE